MGSFHGRLYQRLDTPQIAATAIRLDIALASEDGVFINTPGLRLITAADSLQLVADVR